MKPYIGILLSAALSSAASTPALQSNNSSTIPRPNLQARPLQPAKPFQKSPARNAQKTCFVTPSPGLGEDDSPAILKAFH
ncbi:hypothetical protein E4U22_004399, partial [Claviceps purpurea]